MNTLRGTFTPKHPEKYRGSIESIKFKSSWEQNVCAFADNNPNILEWTYEPFYVQYWNPVKRRPAKYYIDFWFKIIDKNGVTKEYLIEVKPMVQVKPPSAKSAKSRLYEQMNYAVNISKWKATQTFVDNWRKKGRDLNFKIITENEIFKM